MTVVNIQSRFKKTGVYPVNFDAIDTAKFVLSIVTDSKNICHPYVDCIVYLQLRIICYLCCTLSCLLYSRFVLTNINVTFSN